MSLSNIMLVLADEYVIGISVSCALVVIGYVVCSILIMRYTRKCGLDVCGSAMIPVYNLILPIRGKIKVNKKRKEESEIFAEDEEIEL